MNKTIEKFVKRSNTHVREVKISLANSGVADIETAMNRIVDQVERIKKLASRGVEFEVEREAGLAEVYTNLAELQDMASSTSSYRSGPVPIKTIGVPLAENAIGRGEK